CCQSREALDYRPSRIWPLMGFRRTYKGRPRDTRVTPWIATGEHSWRTPPSGPHRNRILVNVRLSHLETSVLYQLHEHSLVQVLQSIWELAHWMSLSP